MKNKEGQILGESYLKTFITLQVVAVETGLDKNIGQLGIGIGH